MKNSNLQLSDTNDFKFSSFKSSFVDQIDVMHKGKRVAIINGVDGALLKFVNNCDSLSIDLGERLEKMVLKALKNSFNLV